MINFITDYLTESYMLNGLVFGTCVLIVYLVITDDRFNFNRKIIFLFLLIIFIIISFIIDKAPYEIIKDLFWYSLVLNGSFIFHTLILNRLCEYSINKNYEYTAFIISKISFTLSLSGLLYFNRLILEYLHNKILNLYLLYNNDNFMNYQLLDYIKYILIQSTILIFNIFSIIFINFIIIFHNYSLLLLGKSNKEYNMNLFIYLLIWFILIIILSIYIGYPRLYIIWCILSLKEIYFIINRFYLKDFTIYKTLNVYDKIQYSYNNWNKTYYLQSYYNYRFNNELTYIYEKPYNTFFISGLSKFLSDPYINDIISGEFFNEDYQEPLIYNYIQWKNLFK